MAKVYLTKKANIYSVAAKLRLMGIVMKQRLDDGSYVVYKKKESEDGRARLGPRRTRELNGTNVERVPAPR